VSVVQVVVLEAAFASYIVEALVVEPLAASLLAVPVEMKFDYKIELHIVVALLNKVFCKYDK
jgi:hypothetical protein